MFVRRFTLLCGLCLTHNVTVMPKKSLIIIKPWHRLRFYSVATNISDVLRISRRFCGSNASDADHFSAKLQEFTEAFVEARELIAEARESIGTVYIAEDISDARAQTEKALLLWKAFQEHVEKAGDTTKLDLLRREYGVKILQLSAELEDLCSTIGEE